jgi:hypothetical protein
LLEAAEAAEKNLTADYTDGADGEKKILSLNFIRAICVIRGFTLIFEYRQGQLLKLPGVWVVSLSNEICFYHPLRSRSRKARRWGEKNWTADYADGADGEKKMLSLNFIRAIRVIRGFMLIFERGHGQLLGLPGVWVVSLSDEIYFYRPLRWSTQRARRKRMNLDGVLVI